MATTITPPTPVVPPVIPRLERLPLEALGWDEFEAFCRDLISRQPNIQDCHHFGKQGDAQLGIDLFANFVNGTRWAFQNKRWKDFGPADAEKTILATSYQADRYVILLSREATAGVRTTVAKHPNWGIWDVRDISQKVRELPLESARRLLDQHCEAGVRRAFLGVSAISTFPIPEDFFRPLENATRLFHHCWSLVGRGEFLQGLDTFTESTSKHIAVLTGRGGIGKTKLLHAFARAFAIRHSDQDIRFLAEGLPVTPDSFDDLPLTACVVVVDDAHRRADDLAPLLAAAQQRRLPLKLILVSRPQGLDLINSLLSRAGIDERDIERLGAVGDLTRDETRQLALQALGEELAHLADRLMAATRDCPLVTVVGGKLLAERSLDPALLEMADDFRNAVLSKFHDVLVGQVGDRIEPALCRSLLALLSAVAPIRPDIEPLQVAAAAFLKCEGPELVRALGVLEENGILLRRGYSVRITPDVLADHLLNSACLTQQGKPTGYARSVFDHFSGVCPTQVLRNLAELDWRIRRATGQETDLLTGIWSEIQEQFRTSPNSIRLQLLDLLRDTAFYQPGRMLELVQFAVRNPATVPEIEAVRGFDLYSHQSLLDKLPGLLKRIAYTLEFLPCCADLLWDMARDDQRETNSRPEHPMRILHAMAEYEIEKPFSYNWEMMEAVRRWIQEPGAHDHAHSPLEILDPILAKSGHSSFSEGHGITFQPFGLSRQDTQDLRDNALSLLRTCAFSNQTNVVLRALKSLEGALSGPLPFFNMTFTEDQVAQWVPEQLNILGIFRELRMRTSHPAVHLRITDALNWHARYAKSPDVKQQARQIILSAPNSFDLCLARALVTRLELDDPADDEEHVPEPWQRRMERQAEFRLTVAQQLWQRTPDLGRLVGTLNAAVQNLNDCGLETNASQLLDALLELQPDQTELVVEMLMNDPDCPLARHFGWLLTVTRRRDATRGIDLARRAVASGNLVLCHGVANLYCWNVDWTVVNATEELAVLASLLAHPNLGIRRSCIGALRGLGRIQCEVAISLACSVELGDSGELASELFMVFDVQNCIPLSSLTNEDIEGLLKKLEQVNSLDHHVVDFLAFASGRLPRQVVDLLLARVERGGRAFERNFEPMPYLGIGYSLAGLANSRQYEEILRLVRDRSIQDSSSGSFWFPKLFREVSLRFSPASLQVLGEWVGSGDAHRITAATMLLRDAPSSFVFEQRDFVSNALTRAYAVGDECYRRVSLHFRSCAVGQGRERVGGGPFPQDVALRDRAASVCSLLRRGSPEHRFYESLQTEAVANIRDTQAKDEELLG